MPANWDAISFFPEEGCQAIRPCQFTACPLINWEERGAQYPLCTHPACSVAEFHSESKTGPFHSVHRQVWGGIYKEAELWNQRDQLCSLAIVQMRGDSGSKNQPPFCRVVVNVCSRLPAPCLAHNRSLGPIGILSLVVHDGAERAEMEPPLLGLVSPGPGAVFSLSKEMKMAKS